MSKQLEIFLKLGAVATIFYISYRYGIHVSEKQELARQKKIKEQKDIADTIKLIDHLGKATAALDDVPAASVGISEEEKARIAELEKEASIKQALADDALDWLKKNNFDISKLLGQSPDAILEIATHHGFVATPAPDINTVHNPDVVV